ncbi:hypothetical protein [Flavobacterium sp.]|uniref:hypothetical protein n=1 Tax=Flavobacterium sp. TaxID=239 RepID=UPI004047CFA9
MTREKIIRFNIFLFILFTAISFAQTKISGNLFDNENNLVSNVTVVVYDNNDNILSYSISDLEGFYNVKFTTSLKEVKLLIKAFNYEVVSEIVSNETQIKNFSLKPTVTNLREVIVKESVIRKKRDTLSYNVASFASEKDRTIADIIAKMPGIDVLPDGKILYQGKPINKYYIEGLDLLEGKYNLANKNLPYNQVSKVQILENHQPIKVLDSLVFSESAALNIKLKNNVSVTGQSELGVGMNPILYEANITPLLFTKTKQLLASYQTNNIGNNINNQIKTLTLEDLIDNFDNNNEKEDWLSIQGISTPNFSEKRWLDNRSHLISMNFLQKLKNEYQLKSNIFYSNDYFLQNGSTTTQYYTSLDTIRLSEIKQNKLFGNNLETNLILERNAKNNYLKNKFQFKGFWDSQMGFLNQNSIQINQRLTNHFFSFNNNFKNIFTLGKQLVTFHSNVSLNKTPQNIILTPGQFSDLLNNGNAYEQTKQSLENKVFFTNNALSFTKALKKFSINQRVGFLYENENLNSQIYADLIVVDDDEFQNKFNWSRVKIYSQSQVQYKNESWRFDVNLPLNFYNFKWSNFQDNKGNNNRFLFEPRFSISNEITSFWKMSAIYNRSYQFGNVNQLYNGYILSSYRNIQRFNSVFPEMINDSFSFGINYRNPVNSWFGSFFYTYSILQNNILYSVSINQLGASELQTVRIDNERKNHNLNFKLNKYISEIKSTFTLNSSFSKSTFFQLVNNNLNEISNNNSVFELKINSEVSDKFEVELKSNVVFSKNKIQETENKLITNQLHSFNLNFYPKENHYLALKSEFLINNSFTTNVKSEFLDFLYRYTWKKKNIDFEFQLNNIFNIVSYTTIAVSDFSYTETNFQLRPRQVFFKMLFSL